MCPWWGILDNMMSVMGTWGVEEMEEMDMCNDAVAAICQDQTSITNYISGGADLVRLSEHSTSSAGARLLP